MTQKSKNRSDFFKHLNHFSKKSDIDRKIRNNFLTLYFEIQNNLKCQSLQKLQALKGLINEVVPQVAVDENHVSDQVDEILRGGIWLC